MCVLEGLLGFDDRNEEPLLQLMGVSSGLTNSEHRCVLEGLLGFDDRNEEPLLQLLRVPRDLTINMRTGVCS